MLGRILAKPFGSIWQLKLACNRQGKPPFTRLAKVIYQLYQYENNSSIAWNSHFSGEPCFPHGMKSIFISGDARTGKNCIIFQQVTIGSITLPGSAGAGAPTIGDNVYIGAGAKIVGKVIVGDNVRIGANAVIYKDVPNNSVVVGSEQRVIQKDAPLDNRFFSYRERWVYFKDGSWVPTDESPFDPSPIKNLQAPSTKHHN